MNMLNGDRQQHTKYIFVEPLVHKANLNEFLHRIWIGGKLYDLVPVPVFEAYIGPGDFPNSEEDIDI